MRVIPVDLIRLDDATWWVRAGSRMMQIEESEWLTTAVDVAPVEVLKAEVPNAASPTVREKAPRKVKAPKAVKAPRAPAPAKVAAKLRREAGLPPKKKRVKPDEAKVARAKKLVEHQSYSIQRAAAAVEVPYGTLWQIAKREAWDVPKRGAATVPEKVPTEKPPRTAVSCPNCRRRTETSPCRHCFERVPELSQ
jgi:hypothetical protein